MVKENGVFAGDVSNNLFVTIYDLL